jgi:bifunctional non-homologous end joining protein LigD
MQAAFTDHPPPTNLTLELLKRWRRRLVLHGASVPLFARSEKPRGVVANGARRTYILTVYGTPHFIKPCSPIAARTPPAGEGWLHEPKLDGYRLQVVKDGRQVRLYSRSGYDWTKRLARMAEALQAIPCRSAVIDGELVLPDKRGTPDFTGLAAALRKRQHELAVYAFDLLHRDGRDLRPLPLLERRRRLERLLSRAEIPCLHLVECFDDGAELLAAAEDLELEGIVSKRLGAPYRSGDCRDWVKVKTAHWRNANQERWRAFHKA